MDVSSILSKAKYITVRDPSLQTFLSTHNVVDAASNASVLHTSPLLKTRSTLSRSAFTLGRKIAMPKATGMHV